MTQKQSLKGKIKEDKDFMLLLAFMVCKLYEANLDLHYIIAKDGRKEMKDKLWDTIICDVHYMEWLWDALQRGKNPIYSPKKPFKKTIEEVEHYLFY